jgi:hypothetical protein
MAALVAALVASGVAAASPRLFLFSAPHRVRRSEAHLDPALKRQLEADLRTAPVGDVESAIKFTVDATGRALHFSLGHKTSMYFGTAERAGNCIEYALLFAALFDITAHALKLPASAYAVHSTRARVLGAKMPFRGWKDHDWVLVEDGTGRRWFVDPTLADAGLGWDIEKNVDGEVPEPRR